MKVIVLSPEKKVYEGDVDYVKVPGAKGSFEILPHHAPIISSLVKGEIVCRGVESLQIQISSGFVEVSSNVVTICVTF
ncbi:MAG: F0F1 ATP synthase subunit epsilon [Bacteroidaceae bacterium]|jgi:F-type H+-transporting ATPase subunit epsilon|nr:F0F1 ATP synthase subunit epsilon [Bacteroidaceae bacterium]